MNLASAFVQAFRARPDHVALVLGQHRLTYADVDEASCRVAALLRSGGLKPGDAVGIMLPNVPQFAAVYYGILRAGGVVVPMNPLLKRREVAYFLKDSSAQTLFAWHDFAEEATAGADQAGTSMVTVDPATFSERLAEFPAEPILIDRDPEDTAVLLYTSGTTGKPKGAELTHANLVSNAAVTSSDLMHLGPEDVVFAGLPLFHAFGQTCTLNTGLAAGATLVLLPRFDPKQALEAVVEHGVTVFAGVPTMYSALLAVPDPPSLPTLRCCVSGGAAMPGEVLRRFESTFDCVVLEGYGLSETAPVASFNLPDRPRKVGSIGLPVTGVEMRIVDDRGTALGVHQDGEIAVRGANVMKGYRGRPEETAEVLDADGWFRTGDIGRVDEDGYFYVVDRKKDLVIRGGYNVYPRELEEVLYEHPAVAEAAVIGIDHDELGQEVGAAVALRDGELITPGDLRDYMKDQVAAYKYPRVVWVVDELPKGPTGKILKREITPPDTEEA